LAPSGRVIASAKIIRSAGAAEAVSVDDGGVRLTVSVPDVLLAGIVNAEQVTPGGAVGQVTETGVLALGEIVIVDVPVLVCGPIVTRLPLKLNEEAVPVMVSVCDVGDTPPPGGGLKVVTATDCGVTRLAAGTCTVRAVELPTTGVAATAVPLKSTCVPLDPPWKLLPFTVSNSELDPDATVVGEMEVMVGARAIVVKIRELLVVVPCVTVIGVAAPIATSLAEIEAVN
jgi:hypothetical protein